MTTSQPISQPTSQPTSQLTSIIKFLSNKNVFVFDTETTGLPAKSQKWGSYWDYSMNDKYDSSRIVSIAWSLINNFDKDNINCDAIEHYIRYPEGFTSIPSEHIHGISFQNALTHGIPLGIILANNGLGKAILESDYIVAHNVGFDYHVLMNELYRIIVNTDSQVSALVPVPISDTTRELANKCILHLLYLNKNGKIICTGELTTPICKMSFPTKSNYLGNKINYKMPKLCELYRFFYGVDFENAHQANGDVKALLEIMRKL